MYTNKLHVQFYQITRFILIGIYMKHLIYLVYHATLNKQEYIKLIFDLGC